MKDAFCEGGKGVQSVQSRVGHKLTPRGFLSSSLLTISLCLSHFHCDFILGLILLSSLHTCYSILAIETHHI